MVGAAGGWRCVEVVLVVVRRCVEVRIRSRHAAQAAAVCSLRLKQSRTERRQPVGWIRRQQMLRQRQTGMLAQIRA